MIRVSITGGAPSLREGLVRAVETADDVRLIDSDQADVGIVVPRDDDHGHTDVSDPRGEEYDAVRQNRPVIVLLDRFESNSAREAYASGASAVLAIDASDEELVAAIRAVVAGLVVVPASFSSTLIGGVTAGREVEVYGPAASVSLTRREKDVLSLLAKGHANKAISARLGITESTVKTHIASVYEKLDARNRAEAVVAAARLGLITL